MLSCAGGFEALYLRRGAATSFDADVPAIPVGRGSGREAVDTAGRAASTQAAPPLQRAAGRARSGHRGHALTAAQVAGKSRRRRAPGHRRSARPRGIPPDGEGPRAGARDRGPRTLGRGMDSVADRIFLETTRRYAPPRLARDD